ncbi:ChbG/HpnK family deacetylase [Cryomorphaceae bacterium 1068]|nr:ChbG/HpnK family deacetylase [Cryomorphaceae bacterium 1068]
MKVIFTADDFGVYDQIDNAVIQAAEAGKINSVAVFPNGFGLSKKIERLKAAAKRGGVNLEIGCHLTTCSGSPLTQVTKNFVNGKVFKPYNKVRRASKAEKTRELDSLYRELHAQIEALKGITEIRHLTCHNNTLSWFEDYFEVYLKVAKEQGLPIRSPFFVPEDQFDRYQKAMGLLNYQLTGKKRTRLSYKSWRETYRKKYPKLIKVHGVAHPSILFSDHYGPPPILSLSEGDLAGELVRKKKAMTEVFDKHVKEHNHVEVVFHIIENNIAKRKKLKGLLKKGWYSGVNHKYVDGRMTEMRSLMSLQRPNGVEFESWKNLK